MHTHLIIIFLFVGGKKITFNKYEQQHCAKNKSVTIYK
jgi:hypothetical protein